MAERKAIGTIRGCLASPLLGIHPAATLIGQDYCERNLTLVNIPPFRFLFTNGALSPL